ncbi:MAG: hypothetical protein RBS43_11310 [Candidatus Cloacimonas sp.]|jgi:hypothetical protein|nr:hypothetical protein [Candidatus Cloacimonas sp.]
MNPIRDDTNKALQYRHISTVLTYLINGLDTRLRGYDKTFSHKLGGGNPALVNPGRDDTNKALQYRHISTVLTYLINGLDTRLRGYDKTLSHKLLLGYDKTFSHKLFIPLVLPHECSRTDGLKPVFLGASSLHALP